MRKIHKRAFEAITHRQTLRKFCEKFSLKLGFIKIVGFRKFLVGILNFVVSIFLIDSTKLKKKSIKKNYTIF